MTASPSLMACPCGAPVDPDECPFPISVTGGFRIHCVNGDCGWSVVADTAEQAIAAWNRRATPPLPAGFVAVPREPTQAMLDALYGPKFMKFEDAYAAMLAAVPGSTDTSPACATLEAMRRRLAELARECDSFEGVGSEHVAKAIRSILEPP